MIKYYVFILVLISLISCSKSGRRANNHDSNDSPNLLNKVNDEVKSIRLKNKIELPFRNENGVKVVRIIVNEIPLDFIFDTGASLISISETEAQLLVKQGTLTEDDFLGVQQFVDANGDVSEGLLVNLKEVDIQGYKLRNVQASIVQNSIAPLLLGQSLLEKFGKVTIDNNRKKIYLE